MSDKSKDIQKAIEEDIWTVNDDGTKLIILPLGSLVIKSDTNKNIQSIK